MSFDLSVLLPIIAVFISVGAAIFWDGNGTHSQRVERYIESTVLKSGKLQETKPVGYTIVRIEVAPGSRQKSSDLKARDQSEAITPS